MGQLTEGLPRLNTATRGATEASRVVVEEEDSEEESVEEAEEERDESEDESYPNKPNPNTILVPSYAHLPLGWWCYQGPLHLAQMKAEDLFRQKEEEMKTKIAQLQLGDDRLVMHSLCETWSLHSSRYFEEVEREITESHCCYYRVAQGDCSFVIGGPGGLPPESVHKAGELRIRKRWLNENTPLSAHVGLEFEINGGGTWKIPLATLKHYNGDRVVARVVCLDCPGRKFAILVFFINKKCLRLSVPCTTLFRNDTKGGYIKFVGTIVQSEDLYLMV
jgi:hypothetical protein